MRVAGEVEFLDDSALKARLIEERPFLKAIVKGPEDSALVRKTKIFMLRLNKRTIFTRVKLVASHPAAGGYCYENRSVHLPIFIIMGGP